MNFRAIVGVLVLLSFILIMIIFFRGGNDAPESANANICHQKEDRSHTDFVVENNLSDLRLNDNYTDIEVISQNKILRAHKVILAAHSKYLDSMIFAQDQSNKKEMNQVSSLQISFIDFKSLEHLLNFMYSDALPNELFNDESEYGNLMKAANELQMDWLKCELTKRLSIRLNAKNAAFLVVLAEESDARFLMILASNYLLDNFNEIKKTQEWQTIANNHRNVLANAIDFHGKLPSNSVCDIECQPLRVTSPSIVQRLRRFFITQRFADSEIHIKNDVDKKVFYVNRAILAAQSPVFRQQFEASPNAIHINITSSAVMEEFLTYMYSGWPSQLKKFTEGLLYLSETYEMEALKNACEDIFIDELSVQNVAKIAEIADNANSKRLSTEVLDFILKNRREVVTTKAWAELKNKNPHLLTKIFTNLN